MGIIFQVLVRFRNLCQVLTFEKKMLTFSIDMKRFAFYFELSVSLADSSFETLAALHYLISILGFRMKKLEDSYSNKMLLVAQSAVSDSLQGLKSRHSDMLL